MTKVYFVRHAKPDFSIKDDLTRPLVEEALKDCKKVTEFLSTKDITKIYSSPYKRAIDTIRDFAENNNLEINIIENFRERKIDNGWIEDFDKFTKDQWEDFDYKLVNGESLNETQKRNVNSLKDILEEQDGLNIVVGSHGTALSTIISYFNKEFGYTEFERIKYLMPFIVCFTFEGKEFVSIEEFVV